MAGKDLNITELQYNYPKLFIKPPEGDEIDAEEITPGLRFLDDDSDPVLTTTYTNDPGTDGQAYSYSQYDKTTVNARFWLHYGDWYDYKLKKHDIANFFMQKGLYRIRTDAEPAIVKYVRAGNFNIKNPEDRSHDIQFSIPFENPSGLKYSLAYSDELMTYDQNKWQLGMNLPNGQDLQYHFINEHQFKIYNASDIEIDPAANRNYQLQIIVSGVNGGFDIKNMTNGDEFVYTGNLSPSDQLVLDGIYAYKNGSLVTEETNLGWIRLKKEWNEFKIFGYEKLDIKFHFQFVYLN